MRSSGPGPDGNPDCCLVGEVLFAAHLGCQIAASLGRFPCALKCCFTGQSAYAALGWDWNAGCLNEGHGCSIKLDAWAGVAGGIGGVVSITFPKSISTFSLK